MNRIEDLDRQVGAILQRLVRGGACPSCLSRVLILQAIDIALAHDEGERVHDFLRKMVVDLDTCRIGLSH